MSFKTKLANAPGASVRLLDLRKEYGSLRAVDAVTLEVAAGEFLTLLGPSGSGKTTILKLIAGFLSPDKGSILIAGKDVTRLPPYRRNIGVVFQSYALFPHLTAAENVAFPLKMRRVPRTERQARVAAALDLVKLGEFGERRPKELSGGQQQRVAMARALVYEPELLLMDEPMGALDKKLREALQLEVIGLTRRLGITCIYVTHDQDEALTMSDRVAVVNGGRIEQIGSVEQIYERPETNFVANFIGESNLFEGHLVTRGQARLLKTDSDIMAVPAATTLPDGTNITLLVRPERARLTPRSTHTFGPGGPPSSGGLEAVVTDIVYLGNSRKYFLKMADSRPALVRTNIGKDERVFGLGDPVLLSWNAEDSVVVQNEDKLQ